MTQSIADTLDAAADLLSKPGAWTQHANARDANGYSIGALEQNATSWCMLGAIIRIDGGPKVPETAAAFCRLYHGMLEEFNDAPRRTQSQVVAKLKEAAVKTREQGL